MRKKVLVPVCLTVEMARAYLETKDSSLVVTKVQNNRCLGYDDKVVDAHFGLTKLRNGLHVGGASWVIIMNEGNQDTPEIVSTNVAWCATVSQVKYLCNMIGVPVPDMR